MKNIELECLPQWRFCNIPRGQKGPRSAGWQRMPLLLTDIDPAGNVGVLLGPSSGGLCALDFDGTTAWSWFQEHFDIEIPATVMWASGKTDRCQMAFRVPEAYWDALKTLKIATGDHEGFEFRWTGGQSVLPPSLHPDTQKEYFWVAEPSRNNLADLPEAILCYWLLQSNPEPEYTEPVEHPPATEAEVLALAAELKSLYSEFDYDTWIRVTWAFCNTIGYEDGITLMRYHWPEQQAGEYNKLKSKPHGGRVCTIGTVKKLIRDRRGPQPVAFHANTGARVYKGIDAVNILQQERYKMKGIIRNG